MMAAVLLSDELWNWSNRSCRLHRNGQTVEGREYPIEPA
jgi:hypothetical protein